MYDVMVVLKISQHYLELLRVQTHLNHFAMKYKLIIRANQIAYQELQKLKASA